MPTPSELDRAALDLETGDLLPEREPLALFNIVNIVPVNIAIAVNAATINGQVLAMAGQTVSSFQS